MKPTTLFLAVLAVLLLPFSSAVDSYIINDSMTTPITCYDSTIFAQGSNAPVCITDFGHTDSNSIKVDVTQANIRTLVNNQLPWNETNTTCALWVWVNSTDSVNHVIGVNAGALQANDFEFGAWGAQSATNYYYGLYPGPYTTTTATKSFNTWERLTIQSNLDGSYSLYVNGVAQVENQSSNGATKMSELTFGSFDGSSTGDSYMDDIQCWSGNITDEPGFTPPAPVFTNVTISDVTNDSITNQTARINFTTNIPCNVSILYWNPPNSPNTYINGASYTIHSNTIGGLTPNSAYEYNLTCENSSDAYQTVGPYSFSTLAQATPVIQTVAINTSSGGSGFSQALNQTLDSIMANVTDADTLPAFVTVETTLHRPSGTASFTNQPMPVQTGTIHTYHANTLLNETGIWTLNVTATDGTSFVESINVLNVTCAPSFACNGYGSCGINDNATCNSVTDLNFCGIPYAGNYSEFTPQACNYCTPTISGPNLGTCLSGNQTKTYYYTNTCCADTGLTSDCTISANTTQLCSLSPFDYGIGDIPSAGGSAIVAVLAALAAFAGLAVLTYVVAKGAKAIKKK